AALPRRDRAAMRRQLLALALAACIAAPAAAKDMASLYDDPTLEYWHGRYEPDIQLRFEKSIRPQLTPEERRELTQARFAFPLRGVGGDPFAFYATSPPPTVNLPVLSLKFLDDLSMALAWLSRQGDNPGTVMEYVGMLKYADAADFGGSFPRPL